jgi:SAM-dependent methyltransferase
LDQRLEAMHSQLVHVESFYQTLGQLGSLYESLKESVAGLGLDRWKVQEYEGLLRYLRRCHYEAACHSGALEVPAVETAHPLASDSDDTRFPWGARNDNSICLKFNDRLYRLFPGKAHLAVLDLGCAGGGFVRSLIDDGHLAVGLDGCDLPKRERLGEWGTIPAHLHTCDVTKPFAVKDAASGDPLLFDAVTAWEVLEHIRDEDLDGLFRNVRRHLAPDGLFLCSVSTVEDSNPQLGAVYHVTVRPRQWWLRRLEGLGFCVCEQGVIGKDDWLRGAANCRYDRHAEDEGVGFHLVLRRRQKMLAAA